MSREFNVFALFCGVFAVHSLADPAVPPAESVKDAKWYWEHEETRFQDNSPLFQTFTPNDNNKTCTNDIHATPFNLQVRGVNLGGLLVLEPWITPTLFYQFLSTQERFGDKAPEKTALDTYTFCTALGKEEANRQLRIHWANWVTEDDFIQLQKAGVNSVRIPIGDYMFVPYEPYIGCIDGAVEVLDRLLDLALKYGMSVLLDVHTQIDSQNGFDNSGQASAVKWTSLASTEGVHSTTFEHWPIRNANWVGTFDTEHNNYSSINYANLNHSLEVVTIIVERYASHLAVMGLEPVNEPWELTPVAILKEFYWKSYKRVKALAPSWKFIMHDSFRFAVDLWSGYMKGCPEVALDTHIYQAWMSPGTKADFFSNACQQKYTITTMEDKFMPVIVGEWSVATDNCAMWLNGFNDNLPGYPKVVCKLQECPAESTYLGNGFPGTPLDLNKPIQGPYGTGTSGPSFGLCPVTSDNAFHQKDDDHLTLRLLRKKLNAWSFGHGWYFWNFKTELDYKWSFLALFERGFLPKNVSNFADDEGILDACQIEDQGDFICRAKRGVKKFELKNGLTYACNAPGMDCTNLNKTYLTLLEQCDWAFNAYWHQHRREGATCDFGGAAHLLTIDTPLPPAAKKDVNMSTSSSIATSVEHKSTSVIILVAVACAVVILAAGIIFRWRQNRLRREQYAPIGRN